MTRTEGFIHRVMTGQAITSTETRVAGLIAIAWMLFDIGWCIYDHTSIGACQ